jgi:aspartate--ammonia ligase
MSFNFFPTNYQPNYSLARTRTYISDYVKLLDENIRQKLNALYVNPPVVSNVNGSWNAHEQNERYITFDNKYTSEVNEIIVNPSNYLRYALITFTNTDVSLYTSMINIKRDVKEEDGEIMVNHSYYIEYHLANDADYNNQIAPLLKNVLMIIKEVNSNEKFKDIRLQKYTDDRLNFISTDVLSKQYPTLTLNNALNRYVAANGPTFINKIYQRLPNGKHLLFGSPTIEDYDNTGILYIFNKSTGTIVPIIKIAVRPTQTLIKQQIILDTPGELEEQIYKDTVLNPNTKFPPSIGVEIYFSNLMLVNLNKMHLCEVIHSPCTIELLKYFKDNEIEVM